MYTGDFRAFHDADGDIAILDTVTFTAFLIVGDFTQIYVGGLSEYIKVKETIPQIFAILQMDSTTQINNALNENAVTPEPIMKVEKPEPKKSRWVKWAESVNPSDYRRLLCFMGCKQCPVAHKDVSCFIPYDVARYMQEEVEDDN